MCREEGRNWPISYIRMCLYRERDLGVFMYFWGNISKLESSSGQVWTAPASSLRVAYASSPIQLS